MSLDHEETQAGRYVVQLERTPDGMVVTIEGEIDIDNAGRLEETVGDLLRQGDVDLVFDMAAVSFIDSVGISVIVDAYKKATDAGGTLALRAPVPAVRRMLEITGLEERFEIL